MDKLIEEPLSATRSAVHTSDGQPSPGHAGVELAIGELVGRYRVRRPIGEGGMGRVYLARDETLGRSVALKIVRPERVSAHDTRRFVAEARTTAKFSHPHIVVLYDVGEHRGAPWLALEYLDGESLGERVRRERPSVDEVLRMARAIADALEHAHAAGIKHCDLKPSNVVLPKDGRLRVVDFGLALGDAVEHAGVAGTPDWMAPEQWLGERLTDRVDVWALGVMAHELLAGEHPFGDAERRAAVTDWKTPPRALAREGVPPAVVTLVSRSLRRDPAERPSAADWRRGLDEILTRALSLPQDESPYRGLAAFGEQHAQFFFGREAEIEAFLERLRGVPVLPIVGPSGAGKSSFLHAGVIPRLRARERWKVIALRPGADPFASLAHRLLESTSDVREATSLAAELRATPSLLSVRLATLASADGAHVLLAIDQLEELFTQGASDDDVQRFLELLASAADDPAEPVRVLITVRDDFLGRVPALRDLFVLKKLGPEELRRTITEPLHRADYRFDDPSLVEDILREVGDVAGDLPLLQFACRALWDARDVERRELVGATYRRLGGVAGALARHADGVLDELSPAEQRAARQLLVRLVAGTTTRRVVERKALLADLPGVAEGVLDRLLSARLVVQRRSHGEGVFLVELVHESLLKSWTQLARWLDESREERRLLAELEEAAAFWERRGAREEETWNADELATARRRIAQLGVAVPAGVEKFLAEGDRRQAAIRRRSRNRLVAGVVAGALVTTASLIVAGQYRRQKIAAEEQAEALRLAGGNLGRIDLVLEPFDWVDGAPRPVQPGELPALSWRLHGPNAGDAHHPGAPLPAELVRAGAPVVSGTERVERVEAPGGTAFLRIDGRGRAGEACAPSWLRLQSLPGYAERGAPPRIAIAFPTCRATAAGMVEIPAGEFIYGGPGEPPTKFVDYVEPERLVMLDAYAIDRTEVSNAAFDVFSRMEPLTGYPSPKYPSEGKLSHSGDPAMPVTSIDAFAAEAFCRFMGKRLPGDFEWTKAARGGVAIDGKPNPYPRRLFPWGNTQNDRCVNGEGEQDGAAWVASVESFACGASPYGVLQLAGNVAEWISREGQTDRGSALRVIRGGDASLPRNLEHTTTVFRNAREARYFAFNIGARCSAGGGREELTTWDESSR